jgi:putative aldouronate transport system substrate-binding protein
MTSRRYEMKKICICLLSAVLSSTTAFASGKKEAQPAIGAQPKTMEKITYGTYHFYQRPEEEQAYCAAFKKDTGVTLEIVNFAKTDWDVKLQAMLVSGDYPDATLLPANIVPLVNQGYLVPIDEYLKKIPGFKKLIDEHSWYWTRGTISGKIYGIPEGPESYVNFWVRKDWLDQLGLQMPKSMTELVSMLEAFKNSGFNAGKDIIPLCMTNTIWNHDVFSRYWGVSNEVSKIKGKFIDPYLTPEFKEYADFMRDLYKRGLLDKEMPTTGYGDARTKIHKGLAGSGVMWDNIYYNYTKGLADNGVKGEMRWVPGFKGDKGVFGYAFNIPMAWAGVLNKAASPDFVVQKLLSWMCLSTTGIVCTSQGMEGVNFTVENGIQKVTAYGNVGNKGQKIPPLLPGFVYPFKLDPLQEQTNLYTQQIRDSAKPFMDMVQKITPPLNLTEYWIIEPDLVKTKGASIAKYIMGSIDYDTFIRDYTKYINEIQLPQMLDKMNRM